MTLITPSEDNKVALADFKHDTYDDLLSQYVDSNGDVDYQAWQDHDFSTLTTYLENLSSAINIQEATHENQLAYWINAYNALTIYGILEKYPTSSIRNHTAKLFGYNIWKDLKIQVEDQAYSLDDIEHKILRHMGEARIHFAIVCASESCPRLLNEAYTGDNLENQFNINAKHFFAQEGNFQLDVKRKRLKLSSILKWFGEDFGDSQAEVIESILPYLPEEAAVTVGKNTDWKVSYLPYSWKLNDQNQ